ncbi:MAG: PilZ domain-containing protein, partial [Polyangiaceae bacterium]|jgi:hypothetical protein
MSDSDPPSDRRTGERHLACFPAALERPDGEHRPSIIRDLSESGALLLVRTAKIAVGDEIKLRLFITDDPNTFRPATGKVVRIEEIAAGDAGPWRQRVAVRFGESLTVYAEEIRRFQERAERLHLA